MTHSAALQGPPLNGQDIGQAEHATRAVLDRLLARTGTQFRGWVILNLLAAGGGTARRGRADRPDHPRPQDRRRRGARGRGRAGLAGADQP